ncbi:sentrin-specific protease 1 isoform X3 [Scleropages formosus]|uniref:sentrin-specific protease 1 isoform X3 n=1 Tax=Scleropages formosus TaxID=113540 RepID=UPI0008785021|nr:sentrin-specific protease 1-like isoform X3 [Scleropages formosus]
MFNKLYEWLGTGIANLRNANGEPASQRRDAAAERDGHAGRKRAFNCLEEGAAPPQQDRNAKRSRMEDFMDTVKTAAEGVKNQGSSVASWVRNNVMSPSLGNILTSIPAPRLPPALPSLDLSQSPSPTVSAWTDSEFLFKTPGSVNESFITPSTSLGWKAASKSDSSRIEKSLTGSKACTRQGCADPLHETPKTNGHSVSLPPPKSPVSCPCPRLGRSLHLGPRRSLSQKYSAGDGAENPNFTSMYEKTFPIRVVQSPPVVRSTFLRRRRPLCTAQESVREEEKEVYRQLLTMVSGGQCPFFGNGNSYAPLRSHRDLTSFLTSRRRLLKHAPSADLGQGELSEGPGASPSLHRENSFSSSNVPSPGAGSSEAETHTWAALFDLSSGSPLTFPSGPNPAALQDTSSQDTQSSTQDGDSVIFVKEQQGKKSDSSVPCFKAELWIKELTSLYDSRARERRRLIEEQEALTAQLLKQRLSEESHLGQGGVELQVRVPLEKEVPLAAIVEEVEPFSKDEEFPELTESMEMEVTKALRGSNLDEVLSEGFRQTITRKDLQTLSHLNWLNDELRSAGFSAVRRWTKKVDIFSSDILLVPIHLGVHWCLAVVDFRKKSISYFDSMGGTNDEACRILLKYLAQESSDKKGRDLDVSQWVLKSKKSNEIPQQMNGSDCGMFTCKYAEYITKDKPITFTQVSAYILWCHRIHWILTLQTVEV